MTWHDYSEQVLGFKNGIYKKYNSYEQVIVDFHASVRDFNAPLGAAAPLPPNLPQDACSQGIPPADGKASY